jgi:hypothetical protein
MPGPRLPLRASIVVEGAAKFTTKDKASLVPPVARAIVKMDDPFKARALCLDRYRENLRAA